MPTVKNSDIDLIEITKIPRIYMRGSYNRKTIELDNQPGRSSSQYQQIQSSNTEFYQDLLKSFGIKSHEGDGAVAINAQDSIRRVNEIGMFRYATSRKENLEKLSRMIETYHSREMTEEQHGIIRTLRNKGKSWGAISEEIFDRYGYTWPYYSISHRAKKLGIE